MIIVMSIVFYKEFGEDSEFSNDCLATQKELENNGRSGPRFLILMKNQKESENKTIIEVLGKSGRSDPRFFYPHEKSKGTSKPNHHCGARKKGPEGL